MSDPDGAAIVNRAKPDAYWWVQTQHPTDSQAWHPLRSICLPLTETPSTVCSFTKVVYGRDEQETEDSEQEMEQGERGRQVY